MTKRETICIHRAQSIGTLEKGHKKTRWRLKVAAAEIVPTAHYKMVGGSSSHH